MASNGWDSYIWQIQNRYSAKTQNYTATNCCIHAAIYGVDGTPWATSSDWAGLTEYDHPLEQDDGSFKDVKVDEF